MPLKERCAGLSDIVVDGTLRMGLLVGSFAPVMIEPNTIGVSALLLYGSNKLYQTLCEADTEWWGLPNPYDYMPKPNIFLGDRREKETGW